MPINILPIRQFLHSLYVRNDILIDDFNHFANCITQYKKNYQSHINQPEPNIVANVLKPFMAQLFGYDAQIFNRTDLVIKHNNANQVIFECKKYDANDMVSDDNFMKKSFYQAIHYFMQERKSAQGVENKHIKHVIITDFLNWYIFDAHEFERLFFESIKLQNIYRDYYDPNLLGGHNTKNIYDNIGKFLQGENVTINATKFSLWQFETLPNDEQRVIYKLLHPDGLLKQYNPNDANSLDKKFYEELLYIMGLHEVSEHGKFVIKPITEGGQLQAGSVYQLCQHQFTLLKKPFDSVDILQLIIIWLNRILFLKLLESQLVGWGGKKFLNTENIPNFFQCSNLFFDILAVPIGERSGNKREYIPYLNSSLFEVHPSEYKFGMLLSYLDPGVTMEYYPQTILRTNENQKTLRTGLVDTLRYLFEFLDAFDFANNKTDGLVHETRTIINASVLGLIFEKINGYQDGSFFTPSFITEYMARESLHRVVVDKVNEECHSTYKTLQDIRNFFPLENNHSAKQLIHIINSITICDPAVGSGHYLVSVLNELVYVKGYLGILMDEHNDVIRDYNFSILNDELILTHKIDGGFFQYNPKNVESARVQRALFLEKQRIIENSLFGVDINPNSVNICRLRLWIELLKNTHIHHGLLQTLPNIDINIKCGNSLVSRYKHNDAFLGLHLGVELKKEIFAYKNLVRDYKRNIGLKDDITNKIDIIRQKLMGKLLQHHFVTQNLDQNLREFTERFTREAFLDCKPPIPLRILLDDNRLQFGGREFEDPKHKEIYNQKRDNQYKKLITAYNMYDNLQFGESYKNAMEWAIEFPEILDENGNFMGFDIIIGNPPYGVKYSDGLKNHFTNNYDSTKTIKNGQRGSYDTYSLFLELAYKLCKNKGNVNFIVPMSVISSDSMSALHNILENNSEFIKVVSFSNRPQRVFDHADIRVSVFNYKKSFDTNAQIFTSKVVRKSKNVKIEKIINNLEFQRVNNYKFFGRYPKISSDVEVSILNKILLHNKLKNIMKDDGNKIYYRTSGGRYYNLFTTYSTHSNKENSFSVNKAHHEIVASVLSSNLFYWFQQVYSNGLDLKQSELEFFPIPEKLLAEKHVEIMQNYQQYLTDIEKNSRLFSTGTKEYRIGLSKHYIDAIDRLIAPYYGLDPDECEFIINYEIDFRKKGE